jgi:YHS domain-containing protein
MNRRSLLKISAGLGLVAAIPSFASAQIFDAGQAQPGQQPTEKPNPPAPSTKDDKKLCPVCGMDGDPAITSVYKGKTYYFCMQGHKVTFEDSPEDFVKAS